jgi:hypothetical protein
VWRAGTLATWQAQPSIALRRADLIDVGRGLVAAGVPRSTYGELRRRHPDTGFRRMLLRAFGRGLRADPLHPEPMLKF